MGRRTLCSTPQSGGYKSGYGRHTTRDGYHKQLSKSGDMEMQAVSGNKLKPNTQVRSKIDPDDDLLTTVVAPAESDTCSATGVGDDSGYSHNLSKAESQESILALKETGQGQKASGIDRSRSSAATVTGMVLSGNGTGPAPTPAGTIMRTQEVTMTVETHGPGWFNRGNEGHAGDMPAYPARTARW